MRRCSCGRSADPDSGEHRRTPEGFRNPGLRQQLVRHILVVQRFEHHHTELYTVRLQVYGDR